MPLKKVLFALGASVLASTANAQTSPISPEAHIAVAPDVAVNSSGEIALMWVDRAPEQKASEHKAQGHGPAGGNHDNHLSSTDLYAAFSKDGGANFSAPTKINHESGVVWGQQVSRPRIVSSSKGVWHVAYAANEVHPKLNKVALTTHYTRSIDNGKSFEPARRVSSLTDADLSNVIHGGFISAAAFSTITSAPDGSVHVMWIDTRNMKSEADTGALYTAVSRDDGKSFATDSELLAAGVCPCCQLMAIADQQSNVLLGSRQVVADGTRQSTIGIIPAKGGAMSKPVTTGGAPWQIAGCPLKPTVVAAKGNAIFTAAYNGGEAKPGVYFSFSKDAGATFAKAMAAHPEAAVSDTPSIAINDRFVLLAWHGKTNANRRVFYRMFDLDGKPAGTIAELPTNPENSQNPVVATRADGKFQIAWQQSDRIFTTVLPATPGKVDIVRN